MEPTDLTIGILREIREDLRGLREDNKALREDFQSFAQQSVARFEAIETTLRDLAQQMVLLARGVKAAIEGRSDVQARLDELERRLSAVEERTEG